MADSAIKRFATGGGPVIGLVLLVLVSLTLMSDATKNSARFGEVYSVLLLISALGLVILGGLIGWNLVHLVGQVRAKVAGARLTARMVAIFVLLAVTPVLVVYYFSLQFLHQGIDSWFDVRVEKALDDALDLSRTSLDAQMRERLNQAELMAAELSGVGNERAAARLNDAFELSGASELTLVSSRGNIIASSSTDSSTFVPSRPNDAILLQLRSTRSYIGLDPIGNAGLHIRAVVSLPEPAPAGETRILQALFPVPERMNELADSVQSEYARYRELVFLRQPLKNSFTLTLSLVLLLSLSAAVWAAIFSARRMVAPLRDMANITRAVAGGDFGTHVPEQTSSDELGFLVESFNDMTRKLARARDETRLSQRQLEDHKTYLEAVLARLSSGVLTFDHEGRLYTTNEMAGQILGLDVPLEFGKDLEQIAEAHPHLIPLVKVIQARPEAAAEDWREEVIIFGPSGRQILMCRGTRLPDTDHARAGHLVVFDDLTTLIEAQRNEAWGEVARRLAHEIKNPLTPIQLSAERLRHKYLPKMSAGDGKTLDRMTRTIVQQVEALKEMVNAFSSYARAPRMKPEVVDLNELITDVLELYRSDDRGRGIRTELDPGLPTLEADPDRLRQVLHNLVKNAVEADPREEGPNLVVRTRYLRESPRSHLQVTVEDGGAGIPESVIERLFEPYTTTKTKGSGLGLAIVKKIVEEHGGVVWAENRTDGGARIIMRFPVVEPAPPAPANELNEQVTV